MLGYTHLHLSGITGVRVYSHMQVTHKITSIGKYTCRYSYTCRGVSTLMARVPLGFLQVRAGVGDTVGTVHA